VPYAVHTPDGVWDVDNNFPKLASSAAHLFGKPKVWTESGGRIGYRRQVHVGLSTGEGINAMQIRDRARPRRRWSPAATGAHAGVVHRPGWLPDGHRPSGGAGGLYYPSNSMWMGDEEADRSMTKLGWQLLEHQVDWDYFDEQSLSSVATIADGGFKDLSGQVFRAIVVPSTAVISRTAIERFQAFVKAGGKGDFRGQDSHAGGDKAFKDATDKPDLSSPR